MRDKRHWFLSRGKIILFVVALSWYVGLAHAEDSVSRESRYLLWIIGGLLSVVQILVGYIYISGVSSIKDSMRFIFTHIDALEKEKLAKEDHKELCDSKWSKK